MSSTRLVYSCPPLLRQAVD